MSYDYLAHTIASIQSQIDALILAERDAERAKDPQARSRAESLRQKLLQEVDPSLLFCYLAATKAASKDLLRAVWQKQAPTDALAALKRWELDRFFETTWLKHDPDPAPLGPYAFSLRFTFRLAQPYFSRDDNAFYIVDNPIARDRTFGLPIVRPSGWKGNLRAAVDRLGHGDNDPAVRRLFGKRVDESGHAGRLIFFPTFFGRTGLEIINPHERATRVGTVPILFETVPAGTEGTFTLLYAPYDRLGEDPAVTAREVAEDLVTVARGVEAMLRTYGFSAKKTIGFGLVQDIVSEGLLRIVLPAGVGSPAAVPQGEARPPEPTLPRYLEAPGRLKREYLNPDGSFRERTPEELAQMKKSARQEYEKARAWFQRQQAEPPPPAPAAKAPEPPPAERVSAHSFGALSELVPLARQIAESLAPGGAP